METHNCEFLHELKHTIICFQYLSASAMLLIFQSLQKPIAEIEINDQFSNIKRALRKQFWSGVKRIMIALLAFLSV